MASVAPRWARGLSSQQLAAIADTPNTGAVPPDEPLAKVEGQPLTLNHLSVKIITLPCGTEIRIYPGTHNGHRVPVLYAPAGTRITSEKLTDRK